MEDSPLLQVLPLTRGFGVRCSFNQTLLSYIISEGNSRWYAGIGSSAITRSWFHTEDCQRRMHVHRAHKGIQAIHIEIGVRIQALHDQEITVSSTIVDTVIISQIQT